MISLSTESHDAGHLFFVIMQKRKDQKIYTALEKTDQKIYLEYEDAEDVLSKMPEKDCFHIVKLVAHLA